MLKKIEVEKLFGVFDHTIPLTTEGEITLILGENGLGKTVILKMIKAFYESDFPTLKNYVFKTFSLTFADNSKLTITKKIENEGISTLQFEYKEKGKKSPQTYTQPITSSTARRRKFLRRDEPMYSERDLHYILTHGEFMHDRELEYILDRYIPVRIDRVGPNKWVEPGSNAVLSTNGLFKKYARFFPFDLPSVLVDDVPEWLSNLTGSGKAKLIETQRLLVQADEGKYRSSVTNYSNQLIETIKNKRSEATDLGSNLDRTYPNRVINRIANQKDISDDFIKSSFIELQNKRALLNDVGLLDTDVQELASINENAYNQQILKEVLSVYIEDSHKKLSIYDDLASRIKLLLDILNRRLTYKHLSIEKTKGFVFTSTINGKEIPLTGLSSGEQHELVLYFELLFNTKQNSLLLIDEPEISLHISWQKAFIEDLRSVTELNNLSVIIATHSPDIIGNHWPLTVQLKGIN